MNMYPSKQPDNGWILCPSKSFPGKFYYFNVTSGETAWCLKETQRKLLKNPPIQRVDHEYPEPSSPPVEEPPARTNYQQTVKLTPYYERTISNYPQDHTPKTFSTVLVQPYDQISKSVPCQIQLPMIWPSESNMPQIVMIVMNQAMRQMTIDEPRQGFRQPNRPWNGPKQTWTEPNQTWTEPNQTWTEPNQACTEPNQTWTESNQTWKEPNEPDRELFIHTGKAPLCERFINYKKPVLELNNNKIVDQNQKDLCTKNQYDLTTNRSNVSTFSHNKSIDSPGPSNLSQNQQKTLFCKGKEKTQNSNSYSNFLKKSPEKVEMNCGVFMPSTSNSVLSAKNDQSPSQKLSTSTQGLFRQSQTNEEHFKQSQTTKQFFSQGLSKQELYGQNQRNQEVFEQSQTNKQLFGQSQTKHELFGQSQANKEIFGQSPIKQVQTKREIFGLFGHSQRNQVVFGQSQNSKQLFGQSQTCPEIFQPSSLESNPFQKLIAEKSTPNQSNKVDFPKSPQSNMKVPSYENINDGTNAKEKSALKLDNKAEISQETDLQNLEETDLRRILMQKKRKSNVIETTNTVDAKKIKTNVKEPTVTVPKKRVTFNLEPELIMDSENGEDNYKGEECTEEFPRPSGESWYVVTDATTLLEEFDVLDECVKSDPKCNLMIPSGVMSEVVALSRGECHEKHLVTLARHLLRGLATPQPYIVVQQSADISLDISTDDSIINCCLELLDKAYVVLITNDEDLQTTAEYLNINCFTSDQIKNSQAKQPRVHFDVKKAKISITDEPEDIEIPTRKFANLSFGASPSRNESLNSNTIKKKKLNHSANGRDLENSNEIKKNAPDFGEFNTATLKKISNVTNSKETTSPLFKNNAKQTRTDTNIDSENQTQSMSSIGQKEITNDKINNKSIFEIDNDEPISKKGSIIEIDGKEQHQQPLNISIVNEESRIFFESNWPQRKQMKYNIFGTEIYESGEDQTQPSIFDTGKYENNEALSKPLALSKGQSKIIFDIETHENIRNQSGYNKPNETETKNNQPKPISVNEENKADIKNKFLEQFLKRFYEKNKMIERFIDGRKSEIGCSFVQVMEDCFNDILQGKTNIIIQKHGSIPPWTLAEALQCMVVVYSNHTYIRDVVGVFTGILNAEDDVPASDVIRILGCGMALVKYLMFITPTTEVLKDTEEAINTILQHLSEDTDIKPIAPAFSADDVHVKWNKRNFVKDRSEVVKYLKKHFPAWADCDETFEEDTPKAAWGKSYNDLMVVRTYGKNLGLVKLSHSKSVTMEPDSSQNIDENTNTIQKGQDNAQQKVNFEKYIKNERENENMDDENVISNGSLAKSNFRDLKLTRTIKNTAAKVLKDNFDDQKLNSAEENKRIESKQTEPKVVRLFSNIDFTKKNTNKMSEIPVFDDFSTHGHTFGRKCDHVLEESGPKILRNIKPINEFEEKIKFNRNVLDLDDLDYSVISKSDENNNLASESTNNNCLSMSLENYDELNRKRYLDAKNDRTNGKNDAESNNFNATNDRNLDSNLNSTAASKESHSMSLENCITSKIYGTIKIEEILTENDVVTSTYYNNYDSGFNSNIVDETNDNYDVDAMNDDFKRLNDTNDVINDVMQKDDMTNDSGFENASQQAYYVMDTFLSELKVAFKAMHTFLANSDRELRSGELPATRHIIRDTATKARANLNKIMENLYGIIDRETSSGQKLKEFVAGAGSIAAKDERISIYRLIVTKCYKHARLIDNALRVILTITDDRGR